MNEKEPFRLPERNPVTHAAHRRQVFLQITLPFVIALLLLLALAAGVIWAGIQGQRDVSRWADISLIWLLLPVIGLSALLLVLVAGITYGVIRLLGILPGYARLVQGYFELAQQRVGQIADGMVEPVLKIEAFLARIDALKRRSRGGS